MLLGAGTQIEGINFKRKSITTTKTGSTSSKEGSQSTLCCGSRDSQQKILFFCRLQKLQSAELL